MTIISSPTLGRKVRVLRTLRAWSQRDLAEHASVKLSTVEDTEGNRRKTNFTTIKKLAKALEIEPQELMADSEESLPAKALVVGKLSEELDFQAGARPADHAAKSHDIAQILQYGLDGRKVGGGVTEWAYSQERLLSRLDDIVGGKNLYATAEANVSLLQNILRERAVDGRDEQDLRHALARMARLTGWLAQDAGHNGLARRYYRHGIEMARSVGDRDFAAYCTAMMAFQAVDSGAPELCLTLLEAAEAEATTNSPLHIALTQWTVQPLGLLGDDKAAARQLMKADRLWEIRNSDAQPDYLYWLWQPSNTPEVPRGFIDRDPATAAQLLESGLIALESNFQRDRVLFLMGLAEAKRSQGELDEALARATEVLDFISRVPNSRLHARIMAFSRKLSDDSIARNFKDYIAGCNLVD